MTWSMRLLRDRPRRFTDNKLRRKNQRRRFSSIFYYSNESLYRSTPHSHTVLPHGRKRRGCILREISVIKADQGNIVWNTQTLFRERTKNTNRHEIASGNNGGKVPALS